MKNNLTRYALAVSIFCVGTINGQIKTNGATQYLLSQTKDISADFTDFSNIYFFADSLATFNNGEGVVKWKRHQLMPRQAFNANTYLHQPLKNLDFPDTAYDNDPLLFFSNTPVNDRCLRIRMLTTPIKTPETESIMLVAEPNVDKDNKCLGLVKLADVADKEKKKVILVPFLICYLINNTKEWRSYDNTIPKII